jgi:hypothetical protein
MLGTLQAACFSICLQQHHTHIILVQEKHIHVLSLFLHEVTSPYDINELSTPTSSASVELLLCF